MLSCFLNRFDFIIKLSMIGLLMSLTSPSHANQNNSDTSISKNIVILLGPPGSGKGTQATTLTKELSLPHISTGDLFRENIAKGTALGKKAKELVESGRFPPDSLVLEMLFDRVSKPDCANGFLLDGFPRTLVQAEEFDRALNNSDKVLVINLAVPDDLIEKRIEGRLSCRNCGHIYNKYFSPPRQEGKCDLCGSDLYQRADDKASVVQERIRVYNEQTKPLIGFYSAKNLLHTIDGSKPADQVGQELLSLYHDKTS